MVRIPIQLNFRNVLFSLEDYIWPGPKTQIEEEGNISILNVKSPFLEFEKDLVRAVRGCPGDVARITFLGEYGISVYEFDEGGNLGRHPRYISNAGPPSFTYYLVKFGGGVLCESGLEPHPGVIEMLHHIGHSRVPNYRIDFGTLVGASNDALARAFDELTYKQKFERFREQLKRMPIGDFTVEDYVIYLTNSADAMNMYYDLNQLEKLKIPFEGN